MAISAATKAARVDKARARLVAFDAVTANLEATLATRKEDRKVIAREVAHIEGAPVAEDRVKRGRGGRRSAEASEG